MFLSLICEVLAVSKKSSSLMIFAELFLSQICLVFYPVYSLSHTYQKKKKKPSLIGNEHNTYRSPILTAFRDFVFTQLIRHDDIN